MSYRWTCLSLLLSLALVSWGCAQKEDTPAPEAPVVDDGSGTPAEEGSDSTDGASIEFGAAGLLQYV
jgi:hypothetical protein